MATHEEILLDLQKEIMELQKQIGGLNTQLATFLERCTACQSRQDSVDLSLYGADGKMQDGALGRLFALENRMYNLHTGIKISWAIVLIAIGAIVNTIVKRFWPW